MEPRVNFQLNLTALVVALLLSQIKNVTLASIVSETAVQSKLGCKIINESTKYDTPVALPKIGVTCLEFFHSDDCTGNLIIFTGEHVTFPYAKDTPFRSFRECLSSNVDFVCPSSTSHKVAITLSALDLKTRWTPKPGECQRLPLASILDSILTFSPRNESHCIQLYATSDCSHKLYRLIYNNRIKVYGFAPNVIKSISVCDCLNSEVTKVIREDKNTEMLEHPQTRLQKSYDGGSSKGMGADTFEGDEEGDDRKDFGREKGLSLGHENYESLTIEQFLKALMIALLLGVCFFWLLRFCDNDEPEGFFVPVPKHKLPF